MKLFVSIPVNGRPDSDVDAEKAAILERVKAVSNGLVELIDTYVSEDAPVTGDRSGVYYLGESIKRLASADAAYFADGWQAARGCRLENAVCQMYGIPILDAAALELRQSAEARRKWERNECGVDVSGGGSP